MAEEKVFRYSRADFGPLKFVPLHYDLDFDFPLDSTDVKVIARQTYRNRTDKESDAIILDAHDLKLESIQFAVPSTPLGEPPVGLSAKVPDFVAHVKELDGLTFSDVKYEYDTDKRIVTVTLPSAVAPGKEFTLRTVSVASPDDKTLEGMYFDYTPEGQPQTIISQCQQYGFQRIVPCIDTMTGKTFYTTRITANSKYTNIVSNGDLVGDYVTVEEGARKTATYYNHKVNMAPYLFFIGVGTYETYKSEVEYPTGQTFDVEILALPGVIDKKEDAISALKSMVDSIIWMQLSTGPEKYEHEEERQQAYALIKERDELKASGADAEKLSGIREKLKELMKAWKETGYVYTGSCYREIGMQNSNYGGMENVGNTTIISSRLTPSKWLVDGGHVYMEGVKIHEFYHNINGSQVTGTSPFEIWLNEAVTVHVQREREYDIFGHDFMRLGHVIYGRMPATGPLALDRAPSSMAVEPEGFNTTHELVSAMTYSKAPEYVKMTEILIGKENFVKALFNYHTKYAFSNATSGEWVDEMAVYEPEGVDLRKMAHGWLKRTGYPIVTVTEQNFNEGAMKVTLTQTGFEEKKDDNSPWIIPIVYSAVKDGKSVASGVWVLQTPQETFNIAGLSESPDFISVGCDWSFYGEVIDKASTTEQRFIQAKSDPDTINRYLAFQAILDDEKFNLVSAYRDGDKDGLVSVSEGVVDLYGSVLNDDHLSDATKARFLGIGSSCPSRPEVSHYYWALSYAQKSILKAVGKKYIKELLNVWDETAKNSSINNRNLKFAVFSAIRASGEVDSEKLKGMVRPLLEVDNMSDRGFALRILLELGEKEAQEVAKKAWVGHTIGCEQYIATVSSVDSEDTPALIRELIKEPFFELALAGHARTCSRAWCGNFKRSLLTKEGLELTKELFLTVGKVNQMSAYGFIGTFSLANKFEKPVQDVLINALKEMRAGLDPKEQESLYSQTGRLLSGLE